MCTLCKEERELCELSKGLCKDGCSTDIACIEKGVAREPVTKNKYYQMKNAKDKEPWRVFIRRWQHIVGPSLGRGHPRGNKFDYVSEMEEYSIGVQQAEGREGRWMTFVKACNRWRDELGWDKTQSSQKWQQMIALEQLPCLIQQMKLNRPSSFMHTTMVMRSNSRNRLTSCRRA